MPPIVIIHADDGDGCDDGGDDDGGDGGDEENAHFDAFHMTLL